MDKPAYAMIPRGTQLQTMVSEKRKKIKACFLWNTPVTRDTKGKQLFATEKTTLKSSFPNDFFLLKIQPLIGIGQSSIRRFGAEYRSQASASSFRAVCLQSARDCIGIDILSSFSLATSNEIWFENGQYSNSFTRELFSFMSKQTSSDKQFFFDETSVDWPVVSENQGLHMYGFSCDLCNDNSSYISVCPISFLASQSGSNQDFSPTTLGEYSPRPTNPMFVGDQQHTGIEKPDVADLRGSQLIHPVQHQQAAFNLFNAMRTKRQQHRSCGLYICPKCSHTLTPRFPVVMEEHSGESIS